MPYFVISFPIYSLIWYSLIWSKFGIKIIWVSFRMIFRKIKKILAYIWLVLTNLDVTRDLQSKKKLYIQSFSKSFETFWCFTEFYFHHKWNSTRMLLTNMELPNNIKEVPKIMEWNHSVQYFCQNEQFVITSKRLLEKKYTFPVVRYFTWKLVLVSNILWLIVGSKTWGRVRWN